MYVIGFWLNKNLKLHTHCVSAKPAFTAIGAWLCAALLAADFWDPRPLSLPGCWRKRITGLGQGFWEASIAIFGGLVRKQKKKRSCDTGHRLRGETELGLFTPREGRWHLGSARWQDLGETRDKSYSPSSKPHSGTLTLHHLWHYPQSPQAMLMLITEMLITQGVTNTPYKSPHPRHREKQSRGGTHSHTQTHFTHGLHPLS